jgi:hypothetical protein
MHVLESLAQKDNEATAFVAYEGALKLIADWICLFTQMFDAIDRVQVFLIR